MEPIVDKDPHLNYEINTVFKKVLNVFLIPVLNAIPYSFQKYIKKTHKSAEEIIEQRSGRKSTPATDRFTSAFTITLRHRRTDQTRGSD